MTRASSFALLFLLSAVGTLLLSSSGVSSEQLHCPQPNCSATITCNFNTTTGLPPVAEGPVVSFPPGWLVRSFGGGAYYLTNGLYSMGFFVSTEGVIVVDTPLPHDAITAAIRSVTNIPVKILIYSHAHTDHIGGANMFIAAWNITRVISQTIVNRTLSRWRDPRRPAPTEVFVSSMNLTLGNQTLMLKYSGEGHEQGNTFVWSAATKVLILIDVIFPGWVPFKGMAISTDLQGWMEDFNRTLAYPFDYLIGGHVNRWGTREDVLRQIEFFNDVMAAGKISNEIPFADGYAEASNPADGWEVLNIYVEKISEDCFCRVAPKWKCAIGGFESFGRDACFWITEFQRVIYGGANPRTDLPPLEPPMPSTTSSTGSSSTNSALAAQRPQYLTAAFAFLAMAAFRFLL